jgi:hypothetical protein
MMERKVETAVTVRGYEHFRVVLKQCTDMRGYWDPLGRIDRALAVFNVNLPGTPIFLAEMSRYLLEIHRLLYHKWRQSSMSLLFIFKQ